MTESLHALLNGLIDYAGLFPPAALTMDPTVRNYNAYRHGEQAWFLARLVMPVARLAEFESAFQQLPPTGAVAGQWRLTAPLGPNIEADVAKIADFNRRYGQPGNQSAAASAFIESVELRAANAEEIRRAASLIPKQLQTYFEIPLSDTLESSLGAIAEVGARAKIRTGGESPEVFPTCPQLASFFVLCAGFDVPFKASAGLHRPVRGAQRYNYKPDSASGIMHGFLNVFLAAAFVRQGMDEEHAAWLLAEESPETFAWEDDGVAWRDHCIGAKQLADARKSFCLTVGSCSFAEPIDNLKALGLV